MPEETQGAMPAEAPSAMGSSLDSFQHVEAIMKDDDVSTLGLDSQDWEMASDMVADTENAVTDFLQGPHVLLEEPKVDLQTSLKVMEETMANLKLGAAASGEGVASAADAPMETEDQQTDQGKHKWLVFGRSNKTLTYTLQEVPFKMEPVPKEIKTLVGRLYKEEIIDLFSKFCDVPILPSVAFSGLIKAYTAMKAQKQHDEAMRQPHSHRYARPGIGSDSLRNRLTGAPRATHQCPECFTEWPLGWDTNEARKCICNKKAVPIKRTVHLTSMESNQHRWLLFVTGNGITWVCDGSPEPAAAPASGGDMQKEPAVPDLSFKQEHAVDIGALAEAPFCPADHSETSLSDYIASTDRLQLGAEVLNRVVDAETFPAPVMMRPDLR